MSRPCMNNCPDDGARCHDYEEDQHENHYHYINKGAQTIATHEWKGQGIFAQMLRGDEVSR